MSNLPNSGIQPGKQTLEALASMPRRSSQSRRVVPSRVGAFWSAVVFSACAHTPTAEESDFLGDWEAVKTIDALARDLAAELVETRLEDLPVRIAVAQLPDSNGRSTDFGVALSNTLSLVLFQYGFDLVDPEQIEKVYDELDLRLGARLDDEARLRLGQLVGAPAILVSEIRPTDETVAVSVRLIETKTGNLVGSAFKTVALDDNLRATLEPRVLSAKVILGTLILIIAERKADDSAWDEPAHGTADPYVLMKVGTQMLHWPMKRDTTTAIWTQKHLVALQRGVPVEIYVVDADAQADDPIGALMLESGCNDEQLRTGRLDLSFGQVDQFLLELVAVPEE